MHKFFFLFRILPRCGHTALHKICNYFSSNCNHSRGSIPARGKICAYCPSVQTGFLACPSPSSLDIGAFFPWEQSGLDVNLTTSRSGAEGKNE